MLGESSKASWPTRAAPNTELVRLPRSAGEALPEFFGRARSGRPLPTRLSMRLSRSFRASGREADVGA